MQKAATSAEPYLPEKRALPCCAKLCSGLVAKLRILVQSHLIAPA